MADEAMKVLIKITIKKIGNLIEFIAESFCLAQNKRECHESCSEMDRRTELNWNMNMKAIHLSRAHPQQGRRWP